MKQYKSLFMLTSLAGATLVLASWWLPQQRADLYRTTLKASVAVPSEKPMPMCSKTPEPACVYKTLMGEQSSDSAFIFNTPAHVKAAIDSALHWIVSAQLSDGGWSATTVVMGYGAHQTDQAPDPFLVRGAYTRTEAAYQAKKASKTAPQVSALDIPGQVSDPATTAMVCMALLRCQHTPNQGVYAKQIEKGLAFLIKTTEDNIQHPTNNTTITGTQPQRKLGQNIDVALTAQFFSNLLDYLDAGDPLRPRVTAALEQCVQKIERNQSENGSFNGSGWAGVLQSSFTNNALESAQRNGVKVDQRILDRSRDYQQGNYDVKSGEINTELGAGVMLYSVSSSSRASAQEARKAKETIETAKKRGVLAANEAINVDNLRKSGLNDAEALRYATAYEVNQAAQSKAREERVMSGFGNNGGEEFLSFLQTGEGMLIARDQSWQEWYSNISGKLVQIQNPDGSWSGHHCITSPVFCTATCLLILSVQNDIKYLTK